MCVGRGSLPGRIGLVISTGAIVSVSQHLHTSARCTLTDLEDLRAMLSTEPAEQQEKTSNLQLWFFNMLQMRLNVHTISLDCTFIRKSQTLRKLYFRLKMITWLTSSMLWSITPWFPLLVPRNWKGLDNSGTLHHLKMFWSSVLLRI